LPNEKSLTNKSVQFTYTNNYTHNNYNNYTSPCGFTVIHAINAVIVEYAVVVSDSGYLITVFWQPWAMCRQFNYKTSVF